MHSDPSLTNEDLAPVGSEQRTWSRWDIAALWVGMAVCIPTYTMAFYSFVGFGLAFILYLVFRKISPTPI